MDRSSVRMRATNCRTDAKSAKSRCRYATDSTSVVRFARRRMSSQAARPRFASRQPIMTRAPRFASSTAVSLPIPVFPPVIITVLPESRRLLRQTPPAKYLEREFSIETSRYAALHFRIASRQPERAATKRITSFMIVDSSPGRFQVSRRTKRK